MSVRARKARGMSRVAVLCLAIVVAILLAWLWLRQQADTAPDDAADSATTAYSPPDASRPEPDSAGPGRDAPAGGTGAVPAASATPAAASPGIDLEIDPASSAAPPGVPGSAAPASGEAGDPGNSEAAFPRHWRRCFRDPAAEPDYLITSDSSTAWSGSLSVRISSQVASPRAPGAGICQVFAATSVKGRRVRLTLYMRTLNAVPGAHMVFRAEGADGRVLAFYNMEPRWVSGTQDWAAHSAVLDVPEQASVVMFGGSLVNSGSLWIDDALIQIVGRDVGVTQGPPPGVQYNAVVDPTNLAKALQNPGFEQTQPLER